MDQARSDVRAVTRSGSQLTHQVPDSPIPQFPDDPITQFPDSRDIRSACDVGRRARLELVFECRRGRTVLAHAYAEPPYRVGRSFDLDGALYVIVVCAGPGIFATGGASNPTYTIFALSLRGAEQLAAKWKTIAA